MIRKATSKKNCMQKDVDVKLNELFQTAITHINCGDEIFAKKAPAILLKIVDENPNFISTEGLTAYTILGDIYMDKPRGKNKAIEYYTKALALTPDDAFSLQHRGFCYLDIGKKIEAIKDLKKAKQLSKKYNFYLSPYLDEAIEDCV